MSQEPFLTTLPSSLGRQKAFEWEPDQVLCVSGPIERQRHICQPVQLLIDGISQQPIFVQDEVKLAVILGLNKNSFSPS